MKAIQIVWLAKRNPIRFFAFLSLLLVLSARASTLHVDLNSPNPTPPYVDWSSAATNIQDAINAAAAGDVILVTNGIYATGGKVKSGDLTNRVALDKPVTVQSVNGAVHTIIEGARDSVLGHGPAAVRCVWLGEGALFTVSRCETVLPGHLAIKSCKAVEASGV